MTKMTGGDPTQNRYGCFLSDLTGFAGAPPATSLGGLWDKSAGGASIKPHSACYFLPGMLS